MNFPSGCFRPKSSRVLGFGVAVKANVERFREPPAEADLFQDALFDLPFGGLGGGFRLLGLLQASCGEDRLEAPGALSRLRRVRFVHDHGEALAGKLADFIGDDRKLLQCGDDDGPARLQGLAELAGGLVDVLHHAEGLLELPDGPLELAVEHAPVGHHHHRVEDAPVVVVMQHREPVGEPGDGEALAAAGRMLDQVAFRRRRGCVRGGRDGARSRVCW